MHKDYFVLVHNLMVDYYRILYNVSIIKIIFQIAQLLHRMFVLDVLNFCFWSDSDVLFTVSYNDSHWTGYRALRAAFLKAIEVVINKLTHNTSSCSV